MMIKTVRLSGLGIAIFLLCVPVLAMEPEFLIRSARNGASANEVRVGLIAIELSLEVSKDDFDQYRTLLEEFDKKRFTFLVDSQEVRTNWLGGGSGSTESTVSLNATMGVPVGSQPGTRVISVTLGNLQRQVAVDFRPTPLLIPVGFSDHEGFLGIADFSCTILAAHVRKNSIKVLVNEKSVEPVIRDIRGQNDITLVTVSALTSGFRSGPNDIVVLARDLEGNFLDAAFTIHYFPTNEVPVGAEFLFYVGYPGSRSGPFFSLAVEGEGLSSANISEGAERAEIIDDFGWLIEEPPILAKILATAPGTAKLVIWEKPHFLEAYRIKQSLEVLVFDPLSPPSKTEPGEPFIADGGVFRCRIPSSWLTSVTTADDADGVYGIAAHGPPDADELSPIITAEYFSDGNSLHETPQRFMQVFTSDMFSSEGETSSAISVVKINERRGWTFDRVKFAYVPPNAVHPKAVKLIERFMIFPETETSFFVIRLTAPETVAAACEPIFQQVVESFQTRRDP